MKIIKELGFEHLPMMTVFIEKLENSTMFEEAASTYPNPSDYEDATKWDKTTQYVLFVTQPLTKGMFVPCDLEGNVLKDIKEYLDSSTSLEKDEWVIEKRKEWKQATKRVLFNLGTSHDYLLYTVKDVQELILDNYTTIEQAINDKIKLTLK